MASFLFVIYDLIIGLLFLVLAQYDVNVSIVGFVLLYIWQVRRLFVKEKKVMGDSYSLIRFNTFFFIMYSVCTFLIPILMLFDVAEEMKILGLIDYRDTYVPLSLFLSTVAISLYSFGYLRGYNIKTVLAEKPKPIRGFSTIKSISFVLAGLVTIYFTYSFIKAKEAGEMDLSGVMGTLVNCFLILPVALCGYMNRFYHLTPFNFFKKYWFIFFCVLYISISMLSLGDRLMAICLLTSTVFVVNEFVYKFSKKQILVALTAGMFFMFLISFTRGYTSLSQGVVEYRQSDNKLMVFQDVYPANACLILGTEVKEKQGLYKPMKIIPLALSPIPLVPSLIKVAYFDGNFSSASYLTNVNKGRLNVGDSGLGTHVVADVYVSWGVIGVFILFGFFGFFVGRCYAKRTNIFYYVASVGFVAWSIFVPRESLFDPYRDIVWMVAILFVLYSNRK